ncbi:hypothetical protein [Citricoccus sp. NR2]|nr:hypothetical protein [Citricoccus sp. NR2]WBL20281.1 hypothetical protein O1A05_06250 [Citricoccus sp. NR2]
MRENIFSADRWWGHASRRREEPAARDSMALVGQIAAADLPALVLHAG